MRRPIHAGRFFFVLLASLAVVGLTGCGSEEPKKSAPMVSSTAPPASESSASAESETEGDQPSDDPGVEQPTDDPGLPPGEGDPTALDDPSAAGQPRRPALKLPADFAAWTDADFIAARKASHPTLLKAIPARAAVTTDKPEAAKLWTTLLATKPERRGYDDGAAPGIGDPGLPPGDPAGLEDPGGAPGDPAELQDPAGDPGDPGDLQDPAGDPGDPGDLQDPAGDPGDPGDLQDPAGDPGDPAGLDDPAALNPDDPGGLQDPGGVYPDSGLDPGMDSGGGGSGVKIVQALISALSANTTAEANLALTQLLQGAIDTGESDSMVVSLVIKGLFQPLTENHSKVVLMALVRPDQLRGANTAKNKLTAAALQQSALRQFATRKDEPMLRMQLAQALPAASAATKKSLMALLTQQRFDNLSAQVVMYLNPQLEAGAKSSLEKMFAEYSRAALDRATGVPVSVGRRGGMSLDDGLGGDPGLLPPPGVGDPGVQQDPTAGDPAFQDPASQDSGLDDPGLAPPGLDPGAEPDAFGGDPGLGGFGNPLSGNAGRASFSARTMKPEEGQKVLSFIWHPQFAAAIVPRLAQLKSLGADRELVQLASTIPTKSMRQAFHQIIKRDWRNGTSDFTSNRIFQDALRDPGLLLVLKDTPREDSPTPRRRPTNQGSNAFGDDAGGFDPGAGQDPGDGFDPLADPGNPNQPRKRPKPRRALSATQKEKQKELEAKYDWMYACEDFSLALMERCRAGAKAFPVNVEKFPIELHKDAEVKATYQFTWPSGLPANLAKANIPTLQISYVRIEEKEARFASLNTHYLRKAGRTDRHYLANGYWYDGVQPVRDTDRIRSVDVRLTTGRGQGAGRDEFGGADPGFGQSGGGRAIPFRPPSRPVSVVVEILTVETTDFKSAPTPTP